ncbi:hypothetical protein NQ314_014583 [Rhamnusium bicolor]|uniref:Double jelly roll-like domain-containing protein n=1 Tax=Rhamnusium bicolor TaxID=1586634 RepID=A0AAV8X1G0_9CUCU|nr:hypothetical protein NQ314_014583 [Rhamnusium bicolor]
MDLLNVTGHPFSDNSVEVYQFQTYQSYIHGNLNYNDEVRIPIQDLDAYTAPCNSYLYIEGKLSKSDGSKSTKLEFINNGIAFIFREIRYEMNGIIVDLVRNVGLVSTIKSYLSFNESESTLLQNADWFPKKITLTIGMDKKVLLILTEILISNDRDAINGEDESEEPKIDIQKLYWRIPHVTVGIPEKLRLNKILNRNLKIPIKFSSWRLIEYSSRSATTRYTWPVKTTTTVETSRHVIIAFHKARKGKFATDMSKFANCNLTNIRIFLNSERYPYNDPYLYYENNKFETLYEMFVNFQELYYLHKTN